MFAGIQTLIGLILRYRVRILYICFLTVPSWGADWRMLAIEYRIFIYLFFGGHAFQRGLPPCGELILPRRFKEKKPKLQKSPIKKIFWLLTKFGKKNADLYKSAFFVKRGNYRL